MISYLFHSCLCSLNIQNWLVRVRKIHLELNFTYTFLIHLPLYYYYVICSYSEVVWNVKVILNLQDAIFIPCQLSYVSIACWSARKLFPPLLRVRDVITWSLSFCRFQSMLLDPVKKTALKFLIIQRKLRNKEWNFSEINNVLTHYLLTCRVLACKPAHFLGRKGKMGGGGSRRGGEEKMSLHGSHCIQRSSVVKNNAGIWLVESEILPQDRWR